MDQNTTNDIQKLIYENKIEPEEVAEGFIQILEHLDQTFSDRAVIRTRNDSNKLLTSFGTNYFTYSPVGGRSRPETIFAGALEKSPRSNKAPVVRVRSGNPHLKEVMSLLQFPFGKERNPEWVNVIISTGTIQVLSKLLHHEVAQFFEKQ